jgi:hypothetical protein
MYACIYAIELIFTFQLLLLQAFEVVLVDGISEQNISHDIDIDRTHFDKVGEPRRQAVYDLAFQMEKEIGANNDGCPDERSACLECQKVPADSLTFIVLAATGHEVQLPKDFLVAQVSDVQEIDAGVADEVLRRELRECQEDFHRVDGQTERQAKVQTLKDAQLAR